MFRRLALILPVALAAAGLITLHADAADGPPPCADGVLATDPAGDTTYAGLEADDLEDASTDVLAVAAAVDATTASFATTVAELGDADPPGSAGLVVTLSIGTDTGIVDVVAERNATLGMQSGSIGGVSEGVTASFEGNTVTVTGPTAALGEPVTKLALIGGETRVKWVAVPGVVTVGPLADEVGGGCVLALAGSEPAPTRPGNGGGHAKGVDKNADKGNGRDTTETDPGPGFDPTAATVTIVDTGIHADHFEFDYDPAVAGPNGQLVGWWDFSAANAGGGAPDAWYEGHAPYDPHESAHGTGTSAMAVGRNALPGKTPSACPGCNLAVAKVYNEGNDLIDGSLADAIRWGVDVVGSEVISISIGAAVPIPEALLDVHEAAGYARSQGVLVVFSNGNGWGNAGIPGQPGGILPYGNSTNVLSVGAAGTSGFTATTDPEVAAQYTVFTANSDGAYHEISGTSFSAPFVAGGAARLIAEGAECGAVLSGDELERLIKVTARDTVTPPTFEGYGVVDLDTLAVAMGTNALCGEADPPTPDPATEFYVENVSGTQRSVWTDTLDPGGSANGETPVVTTPVEGATPAGVLGPSVFVGGADTEVYEVVLAPGESLAATFDYGESDLSGAGVQDFDVALYRTASHTYDGSTFVTRSGNTADVAERITYTNTSGAPETLRVVVYGWSIVAEQPLVITGLDAATLVFDGYTAGQHLVSF